MQALHDVFEEMLGHEAAGKYFRRGLGRIVPPIDVKPQNQHASKAAFKRELKAVGDALKGADLVIGALLPNDKATDAVKETINQLTSWIDNFAFTEIEARQDPSTRGLVAASACIAGQSMSTVCVMRNLKHALHMRRNELRDQEKEFWTVSSRPPNYYARTIALRVARVYAREKGERPSFGTQRDSGAPSTSFARALEKIFKILDIDAGVRNPAEWAIGELTDEDLLPRPYNALR